MTRADSRKPDARSANRRRSAEQGPDVLAVCLQIGWLATVVALVAWTAPMLGMAAHPDSHGQGIVQVETCQDGLGPARCQGVWEQWSGRDGHRVGEQVEVLAPGPVDGSVPVLARVRTTSTTNGTNSAPDFHDEEVITTESLWIMPNWLRPMFFVAVAVGWFLSAMWLGRLFNGLKERRGTK